MGNGVVSMAAQFPKIAKRRCALGLGQENKNVWDQTTMDAI